MTETVAAAVNAMVKARFDAASFPRITGTYAHGPIDEIVGAIATVATGFKIRRYGGKTGCLALVVDQEEMQWVANDDTLNCSSADEPTVLNPSIGETTTTTDKKILTAECRVTWYE